MYTYEHGYEIVTFQRVHKAFYSAKICNKIVPMNPQISLKSKCVPKEINVHMYTYEHHMDGNVSESALGILLL